MLTLLIVLELQLTSYCCAVTDYAAADYADADHAGAFIAGFEKYSLVTSIFRWSFSG